jgi:hypothetical protein
MRRITVEQRRARVGQRHRLAPSARADDVTEVAGSLVALHATDPASVYLAAAARSRDPSVAAVEQALYDDRVLIRMLGMRRTMFVVPDELAPTVQAACTDDIAVKQRRLLEQHIAEAGIVPDRAAAGIWLKEVEDSTAAALAERGSATATELSEDEPRLRERLALATGKAYAAAPNVTSRVLFQLSADGRIVRGRPRGSWISSQYYWAPVEKWLPGGMGDLPAPDKAREDLARRWLAAYGPGTLTDLKWWTGWTLGQAKKALQAVGAVEVDLDGTTGYVAPGDEEAVDAEPWVALLPALDPTPMGWKDRDWYLGPHAPLLFDNTGNIGPSVWIDGRIAGGWAQRPTGEVVFRLVEDVGAEAVRAVEAEAARLTAWLVPTRITPRFRTPLERTLSTPSPNPGGDGR